MWDILGAIDSEFMLRISWKFPLFAFVPDLDSVWWYHPFTTPQLGSVCLHPSLHPQGTPIHPYTCYKHQPSPSEHPWEAWPEGLPGLRMGASGLLPPAEAAAGRDSARWGLVRELWRWWWWYASISFSIYYWILFNHMNNYMIHFIG